ncbi:M16 family metallopeptidase [Blattabacterium cuenoti]|uniref:M16 family metallopeptidase n=1 Tax=Blattabacterium cuenoti TaxID=1653831 RepID=UPI00163D2B8C|nr:pitrilysin family protein [Blattabacterium cuenoti]
MYNYRINFSEYQLSNGLHVILHQDKTHPIVYISVLYHVGSKNEIPGKYGFAHFFEHLMFEETKYIKKGEYFKYIASNGGYNNAYTNQDETYYYDILPSNKLPLALWLESERMLHLKIDAKSINIQREVIKEERKMHIDNMPYAKAIAEIIPSLLFKEHPYKNPIIGFDKDLNSANIYDFQKFYNTYYVPNNAILLIAGDFNIQTTKDLINKYFSIIPSGIYNIDKIKIKEKSINKEIVSTCKDNNIQVPGIFLSYRLPEINNEDILILKVIDNILCSGESSRIVNNIVNKKQTASYAGSYIETMEHYGIYTIYGLINRDIILNDLLDIIDDEIETFKNQLITEEELKKQKNYFESKFFIDNSFLEGIGSNLSHYYLYYKNIHLINTYLDKYKKISFEDIKRVSNQYLNKNNRVCLYNITSN